MRKAIAVLAVFVMVALCVPGAWAGGDVTILGSYVDPITGQATQFVNAKSNDAWRGNQTVIYAMTTDQELVRRPDGKYRWKPVTKMASHDSEGSTGIANNFLNGGFSGLAQMGGLGWLSYANFGTNVSGVSNASANPTATGGKAFSWSKAYSKSLSKSIGGSTNTINGGIGNTIH